jgi:hypothetical protein
MLIDFQDIRDSNKKLVNISTKEVLRKLENIGLIGTDKLEKFLGKRKLKELDRKLKDGKL